MFRRAAYRFSTAGREEEEGARGPLPIAGHVGRLRGSELWSVCVCGRVEGIAGPLFSKSPNKLPLGEVRQTWR